ncbi:2-cys peroxiredoxin [Perkinsela sp. CCAP 1560/4]|nr:2-cys peroxiredoxin [Perkinsela sp. CCAP 1560/4]|eukprot:KNH07116.1 2-cys peroxiredoxin [Perkinsela sp. CCAP 1560/4]
MSSLIGKPAPLFDAQALMPDGAIKNLSLESFQGKYVILLFYPLDFTFVCPTELVAFSERAAEFKALNTEVLGVSVDSVFAHLAFTKVERSKGGVGKLEIPLVSDVSHSISRQYGVLIEDDCGPKGVALRGLFIIDPKGNIRQITVNDLPVGRSVDETLRLIKAFQFHETHGEVCPANWAPGKKTIKPDPVQSQEYFSAQ